PRVLAVRQRFPDKAIADIPGEVRKQMSGAGFASRVRPGAEVAIGVGSRGISNLATIVRATVDYWREHGARPFLFPAMGSHGAATAEGQAKVLAEYGITEPEMGCPVHSQLEVVHTGRTPEGIDTWVDKLAYESGGIMLVGRVKWHTDFDGEIESGLFKMMAIGLGKFAGALHYHTHAYKLGMEPMILSVGRQILNSGKMLGGLAILEDANHNTGMLAAVPSDVLEQREKELLALAKTWMGHIPVPEVDILIVDQMGKDVSGAGMDTKVINRCSDSAPNPWKGLPRIERIFVRELSDRSYGSAVGIANADIVTDRLVAAIDPRPTNVNALTASVPGTARVPMHYPTDRECLEKLFPTVGKFRGTDVTVAWIHNTMELSRCVVSENLLPQIEQDPIAEVTSDPQPLEFDETGNLVELLG
ncbi:MAG: hypothetical protein GY953_35525, partial [bacterium]|nr:hypothetical protein [bacterium]